MRWWDEKWSGGLLMTMGAGLLTNETTVFCPTSDDYEIQSYEQDFFSDEHFLPSYDQLVAK